MRKYFSMFLAVFLLMPFTASASSPEIVQKYIADAEMVGEHRFTKYMFKVYDASLYAPKGVWNADAPFALSLTYLRNFDSGDIVRVSAKNMRQIGFEDEEKLSVWQNKMAEIFPDVSDGITITGIYTRDGTTVFYQDEQKIGSVDDPEFGAYFFGIWLNENTAEPRMRKKLIDPS